LAAASFFDTVLINNEVEQVVARPNAVVRRHFAHRLRFWKVRISDLEAKVWAANEIVQIALTIAALAILAGVVAVLAALVVLQPGIEAPAEGRRPSAIVPTRNPTPSSAAVTP
jgi:hypothetical protein